MTHQEEFRKYLRARRKQAQVADELVRMAAVFQADCGKSLNEITAQDMVSLLTEWERREKGREKKAAGAVGLYLVITSRSEVAAVAQTFREKPSPGNENPCR